jgi:hypothetical protein
MSVLQRGCTRLAKDCLDWLARIHSLRMHHLGDCIREEATEVKCSLRRATQNHVEISPHSQITSLQEARKICPVVRAFFRLALTAGGLSSTQPLQNFRGRKSLPVLDQVIY